MEDGVDRGKLQLKRRIYRKVVAAICPETCRRSSFQRNLINNHDHEITLITITHLGL
jgi:hypothetical protein